MIVVDVNAIAYLWIPGEMSELAERVLSRDSEWVSSILWRSELRNILAGYFRRGDLDEKTIAHCLEGAEAQLSGHEYILPSSLVMQNVKTSTCSAYDCEYVALAEDLGVTLVTADNQILRDFPARATSLRDFAEGIRPGISS